MKTRHFTLIELLVSIAIIMILAGITIGGLNYASAKADRSKTLAIMTEFEMALEDFKKDYGYYPVHNGEVNFDNSVWNLFLNKTPNKKKRSYMEGVQDGKLEDAYGKPLKYQFPNTDNSRNTTKFALWSEGPKSGEEDNICNWKQN